MVIMTGIISDAAHPNPRETTLPPVQSHPKALSFQPKKKLTSKLWYGAVDGIALASMLVKYYFDLSNDTKDAAAIEMHDWLLSAEGASASIGLLISAVTLSVIGNYYAEEQNNSLKEYSRTYWPLTRSLLKNLKNTYRAIINSLVILELAGIDNLSMLPLVLPMTLLTAAGRYFYHDENAKRKVMMKVNQDILDSFQDKNKDLMLKQLGNLRQKVTKEFQASVSNWILVRTAFNGIVDGFYYYAGFLGIIRLSPGVLQIMSPVCLFYIVSCMVVRIHEEYNARKKLEQEKLRIELSLCQKEVEIWLQRVSDSKDVSKEAFRKLQETILAYEQTCTTFIHLHDRSLAGACLDGLRDGLYAFSAYNGLLNLLLANFPSFFLTLSPTVLAALFLAGIGFIIVCIARSVLIAYSSEVTQHLSVNQDLLVVRERIEALYQANGVEAIPEENELVKSLRSVMRKELDISINYKFPLHDWSEVVRLFFSGGNKGIKAIGFLSFILQGIGILGKQNNYQQLVVGLTLTSFIIHAIAYSYNAFLSVEQSASDLERVSNNKQQQAQSVAKEEAIITVKDMPKEVEEVIVKKEGIPERATEAVILREGIITKEENMQGVKAESVPQKPQNDAFVESEKAKKREDLVKNGKSLRKPPFASPKLGAHRRLYFSVLSGGGAPNEIEGTGPSMGIESLENLRKEVVLVMEPVKEVLEGFPEKETSIKPFSFTELLIQFSPLFRVSSAEDSLLKPVEEPLKCQRSCCYVVGFWYSEKNNNKPLASTSPPEESASSSVERVTPPPSSSSPPPHKPPRSDLSSSSQSENNVDANTNVVALEK